MSEIQSALQATITKAISEGSIEAGNVTIFNMVPCIQPTQSIYSIDAQASTERAARTLYCSDTLRTVYVMPLYHLQ